MNFKFILNNYTVFGFLLYIFDTYPGMFPEFLSNEWVLIYGGLALTVFIVFIETAFFFGTFIPGGEILLFISGLLGGSKWVDVNILLIVIPISLFAFMADLTAYSNGYKMKENLFTRPRTLLFKRKHLKRTLKYYQKYGERGIIIARFFPVIRTFNPLIHGAYETGFNKFFILSGIGSVVYVNILILSGFFIGKEFPELKENLNYIVAAVISFIIVSPLVSILRRSLKLRKEQ